MNRTSVNFLPRISSRISSSFLLVALFFTASSGALFAEDDLIWGVEPSIGFGFMRDDCGDPCSLESKSLETIAIKGHLSLIRRAFFNIHATTDYVRSSTNGIILGFSDDKDAINSHQLSLGMQFYLRREAGKQISLAPFIGIGKASITVEEVDNGHSLYEWSGFGNYLDLGLAWVDNAGWGSKGSAIGFYYRRTSAEFDWEAKNKNVSWTNHSLSTFFRIDF